MKNIFKIEQYMTPMPHTIGKDLPIQKAIDLMKVYRIRHLPVQSDGKLVGIISDRDLKLASSFSAHATTPLQVDDLMTAEPYTVQLETPLNQVAAVMAQHRYGCAIVVQRDGKVVGIFTAIDALRILSELLLDEAH